MFHLSNYNIICSCCTFLVNLDPQEGLEVFLKNNFADLIHESSQPADIAS